MQRARRWMLGTLVCSLLLFGVLAVDQAIDGPITGLDNDVNDAVSRAEANGVPLHEVGTMLSTFGETWFTTAVTVVAIGWLLTRKQRALALWLGGIAIGTGLLSKGLKLYFARDRPGDLDELLLGNSFPSGHTLGAACVLGAVLVLTTEAYTREHVDKLHTKRLHWAWAFVAWVLVTVLTAMGRILEQRHWMSDTLASGFVGAAVCSGALFALSRARVAGDPGPQVPETPATPAQEAAEAQHDRHAEKAAASQEAEKEAEKEAKRDAKEAKADAKAEAKEAKADAKDAKAQAKADAKAAKSDAELVADAPGTDADGDGSKA